MSENLNSNQEKPSNEWPKIVEVLSHRAHARLNLFGHTRGEKTIAVKTAFSHTNLEVIVQSKDIDMHFIIDLRVSEASSGRMNSIDDQWLPLEIYTGEHLPYVRARFSISIMGALGKGWLRGQEEDIPLRLFKYGPEGKKAVMNLENIAKLTIDNGLSVEYQDS